jgi:hypothetical protein
MRLLFLAVDLSQETTGKRIHLSLEHLISSEGKTMKKSRLIKFLVILASAPAYQLAGQNLLENPGFATNVEGWNFPFLFQTTVWDSVDRQGSADSGSALMTSRLVPLGDLSLANAAGEQCVPVLGGHEYVFGASLYVSGPAPVPGSAGVGVVWSSTPNCSSQLDRIDRVTSPIVVDTWTDVQSHMEAPAGSVSALVSFGASFGLPANSSTFRAYLDDAYVVQDATCLPTPSHLCLGNRFLVYGDWAVPSQGRNGYMRALSVTADSGLFWFFSPDNVEIITKVLKACEDPFNRYWVFASGLTNVEVNMHVDDTVSGQTRLYQNAAGTAFPPIQDTSAFATCP